MLRILLISAGAILETLFIMRSYRRRDGMSVFLKTAASLVFVLLGLLELRRTGTSVYGELVVAGLTLGMLGDLLLALRYLGQKLHHFFFAAALAASSVPIEKDWRGRSRRSSPGACRSWPCRP